MRQAAASALLVAVVAGGVLIASASTDTASLAEEAVFEINRFTIDGGGDMLSVGGGFELSGTIGQPDAGVLSGGGFVLAGGFWFGQSPGDGNEDGAINLIDYRDFEACASGPDGGPIDPSCAYFDLNADHDVDLEDFGAFQRLFSGS